LLVEPGGALVDLAPELPAGSQLRSASLDGKKDACEREELPAATRLRLNLQGCSGQHTLRLRLAGGVNWLPVDEPLIPGATSRNLRVIRARWDNASWRLWLEGLPGRDYPVDFFTDRSLASGTTDRRIVKRKGGWRVVFTPPSSATTNAAGFAGWDAEVRFR